MAALLLRLMALALLIQGSQCSLGDIQVGCKSWEKKENGVCCNECHPGNHLVERCGLRPADLCKPCEPGTFTVNPLDYRCYLCNACIGAQVQVKNCTARADTVCKCIEGYHCENSECSRCQKNNQTTSKPLDNDSTEVPVDQVISRPPENTWTIFPVLIVGAILMTIFITFFIAAAVIIKKRGKKAKMQNPQFPIVRTPTDDPRTLIAIECSFHEAQQEQGTSTESLISK
ncbi:tumor necrosis factor receptor superfamily member 26 [Oryzias latipes]|uniref:TNFR-Cys domain-containing protein n=1 Tax=Oryzias latipes TaxID=8090 RepID=H2MFS0_ORYLA|nr:tumor necrosis factor receptor superfamily member 26 [Oryzias latipes]